MIRTLGKHIKGYITASILTPLCMLAEVVVENFIPLLMSVIIDSIGTGDLKKIYITSAIMLLLAIAGLITGFGGGVFGAKASTGFAKNFQTLINSAPQVLLQDLQRM